MRNRRTMCCMQTPSSALSGSALLWLPSLHHRHSNMDSPLSEEKQLTTRQAALVDSAFEEGQYESGIAMLEQLCSPTDYPSKCVTAHLTSLDAQSTQVTPPTIALHRPLSTSVRSDGPSKPQGITRVSVENFVPSCVFHPLTLTCCLRAR